MKRGWRRPDEDKVTPDVHRAVLIRDRMCFLYRIDPTHQCMDRFGRSHSPYDQSKLTVDHVHLHAGGTKAKRAPSKPWNLVAMCGGGNNSTLPRGNGRYQGPTAEVRQKEREYLLDLYPQMKEGLPAYAD